MWEYFPCVGRLPMCGKSFHTGEVYSYVGGLPIHGESSHIWEVFPSMGTALPQYLGMHARVLEHPSIWECIPKYWGTPVYVDAPVYGHAFPYCDTQYMCYPNQASISELLMWALAFLVWARLRAEHIPYKRSVSPLKIIPKPQFVKDSQRFMI